MADAFLHRRSIFDKHKDSYSFKNPIKQMRVSRSWSNPITRHKREKSLHDWANSFAGKRHYRKLSRHNALHLHEEVESLGIPAVYSGSTLTLADGSVVTGISPGIRGKCNVTINAVREGDFIRLIPDWDEQGNVFDREVHSKYELDYTNHGTEYDHSIVYLNDLGALAHHEAFHLCEEHMSYDIKDLRDKLCTYLKNEVEKVDLDYDVKKLEDSPYPSLAITSKPDDGHYYLEGYLVELKPSDVRFKYQYYGHPHEEVVIVGDDAQDLDVIAKYLFAQVEPKVAEDLSLSNQEIVDAIKKADAATQSDERPFVIDIDDKGSRVDVWLKSKETGKDIWNPSWGVVTGVKKIATYDTDENGSADVVGEDPYGSAEDITAFFTKAFNDKAGVKGEAYGGARFGRYDIVQALAKALHNDEDDKYSIRYFDSGKVGIEPGYAYASNKEGEDAWKVLDDGTVEFEFAGKPQGKTKIDSLSELESTILKLFGLQLGSNGEVQEATDESKGTDEAIEYEKGHTNSRGEDAPWVIRDHKGGKILASFAKKADAEAHLERMHHYSKSEDFEGDLLAYEGDVYKALKSAAVDLRSWDDGEWSAYVQDCLLDNVPAERCAHAIAQHIANARRPKTIEVEIGGGSTLKEALCKAKKKKLESMGSSEAQEGITSRGVQAAVRSAWSSSNAKDFKLDIEKLDDVVRIRAMDPKGKDNIGIWWVVSLPDLSVDQYAEWGVKPYEQEPERTFDAKDLDELENQFVDEFKSLQETLDIAKENS